jgi:ATP-dependent DNA helicase RecQ
VAFSTFWRSASAVRDATRPSLADAEQVLARVWSHSTFRHHQRRAILAALQGRDCLAVLPTGGGKSICFQVPALVLPGLTVVISPLISLMQDQVAALQQRGVAAAYLSSTLTPAVRSGILASMREGRLKLLYVAPERLDGLTRDLQRTPVALLAVDEAHCISEWGHEFRPHYRTIGRHRSVLGSPPTIALTGTATAETRADIVRTLHLKNPVLILRSFDRPNLYFAARKVGYDGERLHLALRLLRATDGTAIVYVPTRNQTDGVTTVLRHWGLRALPYHAGLPASARRGLLARFLDGRCRVIVATNAFGMGIDKPDVRLVLHLGVPGRPEAYFQEAGRAGRDGVPAACVMLWTEGDLTLARRLLTRGSETRRWRRSMRASDRRGLDAMAHYVRTRGCRRRVLLDYLGERDTVCSGCDRCRSEPLGLSRARQSQGAGPSASLQMSSSDDESSGRARFWREVDAVA